MYHNKQSNTITVPKSSIKGSAGFLGSINHNLAGSVLRHVSAGKSKVMHCGKGRYGNIGTRKGTNAYYMRAVYVLKDDVSLTPKELQKFVKEAFGVTVPIQQVYSFRYMMRKAGEMESFSTKAKLTDYGLSKSSMIMVFPNT